MPPVKILIAQAPRALAKTESAFTGYDILTALDIKAAEYWLLRHEIDAFIIGVHFDDSRGVQLASIIRNNIKHKNRPIIMVRLLESDNLQMFRTTFGALIESGTIDAYLEFDSEDPEIPKKIRQAMDSQLQVYRTKTI
jgi:response regulator RpfG family c-di-GMP phosphodiesterase